MAKWIKNVSGQTKTYSGIELEDDAFLQIPYQLETEFQNNAILLSDILSGDAKMSSDGASVIDGQSVDHINYLRNDVPIHSETGGILSSPKYAPDGWTQRIHEIQFTTSKLNSIHDKDWTDTDFGWGSLKFYDSQGNELTNQTAITLSCVRTDFEWMPDVDFMIKGGRVAQKSTPLANFYVWVQAAVLDEQYGGPQSTFCDGGINMCYVDGKTYVGLDGVSGTVLYYEHPQLGPGAGTNKIRFICRHATGLQHDLQVIFDMFRE